MRKGNEEGHLKCHSKRRKNKRMELGVR